MSRLRVAVWRPQSCGGLTAFADEQAQALARHADVRRVGDASARADADLDLYHVADLPEFGFVYAAALARPGVVVLHDWGLHGLRVALARRREERRAYLDELVRAHGDTGEFVGREVLLGRAGHLWPSLYAANDRLLDASLAAVGLTAALADAAARRLPARPVLRLARPVVVPRESPTRDAARAPVGVGPGERLVVSTGANAWAAGLARRLPMPRCVTCPTDDPEASAWLSAADVVLAGSGAAALRALALGCAVLMDAADAGEFPEGVVVPVAPGRDAEACAAALVARLFEADALRARIGALAAAHVRDHHGLTRVAAELARFLADVHARRAELEAQVAASRPPQDGLRARLLEDLRVSAHGMGLPGIPRGLPDLLLPLA